VFAEAMLNKLSMDFAFEKTYADVLRYNSFRRLRRVRNNLGRGFVFSIIGNKPAHSFDITDPSQAAMWKRRHGRSVLDFGAGHLTETALLRKAGVRVTPFEPYRIDQHGQIDKESSLETVREFLADVAAGVVWDSVFISSVLNSVPFVEDRQHIVKILAACCSKQTRVYAVASSDKQVGYTAQTKGLLSQAKHIKILANYEENVTIGDVQSAPKAQKYHTPRMIYDLFKTAFDVVAADYDTGVNVSVIAHTPKSLDGLRAALEFEFDLPYPDGSRMGMVSEAIAAFETRKEGSVT
jgi:hypothetical protein